MHQKIGRRRIGAILGGVLASLLVASSAMAFECINPSKQQAAGVQLVLAPDGSVVYISRGLATRIEQGLIDFETGAGFHGLIGFDDNGDGIVDGATYIVGPDGEIPLEAQLRGASCRGITNVGLYLEQCLGE
jgi:hypothetical protein